MVGVVGSSPIAPTKFRKQNQSLQQVKPTEKWAFLLFALAAHNQLHQVLGGGYAMGYIMGCLGRTIRLVVRERQRLCSEQMRGCEWSNQFSGCAMRSRSKGGRNQRDTVEQGCQPNGGSQALGCKLIGASVCTSGKCASIPALQRLSGCRGDGKAASRGRIDCAAIAYPQPEAPGFRGAKAALRLVGYAHGWPASFSICAAGMAPPNR